MKEKRIAQLLADALERTAEERSAYVEVAADGDEEIRAELTRLLAAHDAAEGFLEAPVDPARALALLDDREPPVAVKRIGPYRLVREIGSGGMGTVYLAERYDGGFEQRVALKLIQHGMDSDAILRRFLNERRILARLQHPHIARLYDGGLAEGGRPYFVMEYVDGSPITRYCAARKLDLEARLDLFRDVCRAVQHAHASLVVHRDLKPSNILVTGEGEVRLLDFGIARLTAADESDEAAITVTAGPAMTPQYASPEQFRGDPITIASDLYQLGLLLYELIAGCRPYELSESAPQLAVRLVCEEVPQPPSKATARAAGDSSADGPGAFAARSRGELDTIVLKALEKEPAARYSSADELREDVERYLAGRPIAARAPTVAYVVRKFVARHLLATGAAAVAVIAFVVMATVFTLRLLEERDQTRLAAVRAQRLQLESEEVTRFLTELFEVADPGVAEGRTVTARELLDRGADRIERELGDQPQVRARLLHTIGVTYRRLGLYDEAEELLREALALRQSMSVEPIELARSLDALVTVLRHDRRFDAADGLHQRALSLIEESYGPDHRHAAWIRQQIGALRWDQGRLAEAEVELRRALEIFGGLEDRGGSLAESLNGLALVLRDRGELRQAAALFEEAIVHYEGWVGADHPWLAQPLGNLAALRARLGEHDVALALQQRAYRLSADAYGADHLKALMRLNNLGANYRDLGDLDRADEAFARVEAAFSERERSEPPWFASVLLNRGSVALDRGRFAEAEAFYRRALGVYEAANEPRQADIALALNNLGEAIAAQDRLREAAPVFRRSLTMFETSLDEEHLFVSWPLLNLARLRHREGDVEGAGPLYRRALEIRRRHLEPAAKDRQETEAAWADFVREVGSAGEPPA